MRSVLTFCSVAFALIPLSAFGQGQARRAAGVTMTVEVTDRTGNPLENVQVALAGPVDRSGTTDAKGTIAFRTVRAGTYRLRFEHDAFTTLEREVIVSGRQALTVAVALTPAPVEPPEPEPEPAQEPEPPAPVVIAEPRVLSIPDFLDRNLIRSEPQKTSLIGCAQGGTARLLQVREPLDDQIHGDVDEVLYVVAGDGTVLVQGRQTNVSAGYYALVPRGAQHSIRRQGRNPLIMLSILAGTPCLEGAR